MTKIKLFSSLVIFVVSAPTFAVTCSDLGYGTRLKDTNADPNYRWTYLSNKRILATEFGGTEEWNEDHCAGGALYKLADPLNPVTDPRALRGSWAPNGSINQNITYNYGGANIFTWSVWRNGAGDLCWKSATDAIATSPAPAVVDCNNP